MHIAKNAQTCWFKQSPNRLKNYRLAPEINSFSGQPRILLVHKKQPTGLPVLVVSAKVITGGQTHVTIFGPLLNSHLGSALEEDIARWSKGHAHCT